MKTTKIRKFKEIKIRMGKTKTLEFPNTPVQAPSFFKWEVEFSGGNIEIDRDAGTLKVTAKKLGSHTVSFIPATIKGKVLMSGQYIGCGNEHKVLVTVYK